MVLEVWGEGEHERIQVVSDEESDGEDVWETLREDDEEGEEEEGEDEPSAKKQRTVRLQIYRFI